MPEKRSLLVARDTHNARPVRHDIGRDATELPRAPANLGQHAARDVQKLEQLVVPIERVDIEEHRSACVRVIRREHQSAREIEDEPRVDGAEEQLPGFGKLSRPAHVVQNPRDLGGREVGIWGEPGLGANHILVSLVNEALSERCGAAALPTDGVVDGLSAIPIPDHRGFALVGDADRLDAIRVDAALELHFHHDGDLRGEDLGWVLLHPSRMRVRRFNRTRRLGHDAPVCVDDHGTHRCRAAINRHDV